MGNVYICNRVLQRLFTDFGGFSDYKYDNLWMEG